MVHKLEKFVLQANLLKPLHIHPSSIYAAVFYTSLHIFAHWDIPTGIFTSPWTFSFQNRLREFAQNTGISLRIHSMMSY